ncbi:hypothetical protein GCM10010420_23370 [Streptomyces glaucosporus]|uniref:Secreted protein n=1 Tax=Streptomyces glaucosporus TaxID=284044 RepID=A0ABP5V915_9ACTN
MRGTRLRGVLRGLAHAGAWVLATGAGMTLSWYGVNTVVSGTSYDPPRVPRISGRTVPPSPAAEPSTDSTRRPRPPAPSGSVKSPRRREGSASPAASRSPGGTPRTRTRAPAGEVESRSLRGGRVAFDLGPDSATLVSATPHAGWEMRVWRESDWIRVTFTRGAEASTVFCLWNGTPPRVVVDEHGG